MRTCTRSDAMAHARTMAETAQAGARHGARPCGGALALARDLDAVKRMVGRSRSASETWDLVQPLLHDFGITRVGDITGLDRIGIPVWIAVRPNSRTLSVSQGKGLDPSAARVSAAMESIETAVAERPTLTLELATVDGLASTETVVDIAALPRPRVSLLGSKRPLFWTPAIDWKTRRSVWVPYELVYADATLPPLPGCGSFVPSTNGLASGNDLAEAIHHGLCEVIERDALSLWDHLPAASQERTRLDLRSVTHPVIVDLLMRFEAARITPIVWDIMSDIGVPAYRAVIHDETSDPVLRPIPAAFGAGCHPSPVVAITRALTEAAQSRLTVISGSRDDFGRSRYADTQSAKALAHNQRLASAGHGPKGFDEHAQHFDSAARSIDRIADRLAAIGMEQVLYVDLGAASLPVSVARVVVPGLEGPNEAPQYAPGTRARAQLAREPS